MIKQEVSELTKNKNTVVLMGKKTWLKWKTILHNDAIYWVLSNYCQANALKSFATWIGLSSLNREKGTSYLIKLSDLPKYYGITKCKTKL